MFVGTHGVRPVSYALALVERISFTGLIHDYDRIRPASIQLRTNLHSLNPDSQEIEDPSTRFCGMGVAVIDFCGNE
jgi:hypothetical protein